MLFSKKVNVFCTFFLATLLVALFNSPYTNVPHFDTEVYRHIGMNITKGYMPYKDVFDHKPPLVHLIAAMLHPLGIWGNWFFGVVCAAFAAYVWWLLSIHYQLRYTWVLPLLFIFLLFWPKEFMWRYTDTRFFTTVFLTMLLYLVLTKTEERFFFKGILTAFIFLTQQNEVLIAAIIILLNTVWLFKKSIHSSIIFLGVVFAGFLTMLVVVLSFFYYNNALNDLIFCVFTFNIKHHLKSIPFASHMVGIKYLLIDSFVAKFCLLLSVVFLGWVIAYKKDTHNKYLATFALLVLTVSVYNISLSARYSTYYTIHVLFPCMLMLLLLVKWIGNTTMPNLYKVSILSMVFIFVAGRRATIMDAYKAYVKCKWNTTMYHSFYKDFKVDLDLIAGKRNGLFVLNNAPALSLATQQGITCNTRWMLNYFWNAGAYDDTRFDSSRLFFNNELLTPLRKQHPDFLIFYKEHERNPHKLRNDIKAIWTGFIDSNYVYYKTCTSDTEIVMYRLKDQ
jgi:hypothetical protein